MICRTCLAVAIVGSACIFGDAARAAYDFSALSALAEGALAGENVDRPVAGFEIRLLRGGTPIYHEAFGAWSLDRPANADSSSKTLSGALVMSLIDSGAGGFSLDSRLADFLPEYDDPGYRDITIRQAFSHTSGIVGDEQSSVLQNPNITLRQAAWQIRQIRLAYTPGSTFSYGGLSMQAAGAAAEVAAGESFVDLMADRITAPLGMTNTRFVLASQTNPRVAGGIESTATDFSRFMNMLANDGVDRATGVRILSAAAVSEMFTRQTSDGQPIAHSPADNNRYGVGVWLDQLGEAGPPVEALAAGARGFHSWIDESRGLVFTFATDLSHFANVELLSSMMHAAILEAVPAADFTLDGAVDCEDLAVWKDGFPASAAGDANQDGVTDGADFLLWQRENSPAAAGLAGALSVPEPASAMQFMIVAWLAAARVARRRGPSVDP